MWRAGEPVRCATVQLLNVDQRSYHILYFKTLVCASCRSTICDNLAVAAINKKLIAVDFAPFGCEAIVSSGAGREIAGGIGVADG